MKLTRKILKNRKAMTPLMIGIIVAASVIAVIFVVMAGVITVLPHDVTMTIRDGSIKGKNTLHQKLEFQIQCENEEGVITRVEIKYDGLDYGFQDALINVDYRTTATVTIDFFFADTDCPFEDQDVTGKLEFNPDQVYTLIVFFQNVEGNNAGYVSLVFTYNIPS